MATFEYPDLGSLTTAEQRDFWQRSLRQMDALTLEAYINAIAEPEGESERRLYEQRVGQQLRLRRAHSDWLKSLPPESIADPDI